ncbi:MAG TPA: TorF family putative porin [Gemmatimonadales bacterium]|nr:TorF family putative porin [Gemmatimonadales bacterium]
MKRANVLGAALVVASAVATTTPATAQTVGADLGLFSSYVWRGLSLTNKPVAQPDLYVTFPAGKASVTLGGWANVDLGKYDNATNDISESGGTSAFNFAEFDPWAEISVPAGKATLTGGITGYFYPNNSGLTSDFNTWEVYGKVAFDVPLAPKIAAWYDIDKVKGLYVEGSISHSVPLGEKNSLSLGALAGFNAGQDANFDSNGNPQSEFFNFSDNGFTHLDLSAGVPLTAGSVSITPAVHFLINGDEFVKITSPTKTHDVKVWGGVTLSWSKSYGAAAETEGGETSE